MTDASPNPPSTPGTAAEVFRAFLRLGLLSFGGPIAHLGYFHTEFVERRLWCSEESFAEIVALAQSMPGPASSQVGFALGLLRAGWPGALAAWIAFTMPSALLMLAFAFGHQWITGKTGLGVVHGLQLVAVAVVAQAILSMRKSLAPDLPRLALAAAAAGIMFFAPPSAATILAILFGAFFGLILPRPAQLAPSHPLGFRLPKSTALAAAAIFFGLLFLLPIADSLAPSPPVAVFNAFYRAGALVFGGGHVVLPLLENAVVARGWVDQQTFLSGYGAAQALPGPLFTFAAYLGAVIGPAPHGLSGAIIALVALFLPGLLLVYGMLPFWDGLRLRPAAQAAMLGANAAVVGILGAALYNPVWTSAVLSPPDFVFALAGFLLLTVGKAPPWIIVLLLAAAGTLHLI